MGAQCGGGTLFGGIGDMQDFTTDELALLEETCPSATTTSGTDDSSTTDEESDSSTTNEETSNCGFISLGWLSASLPLVVAALRFETAQFKAAWQRPKCQCSPELDRGL